ncbi:DegV family protein [Mechercharimyces sp. CAU 1602]|uniref:DegV family protein n=1 Tax=Mechercharimyces sp. CAU 1602 TaxID=2973933 RepID=UPI00216157B0|nr:DegV family protein [Mechercharimyces sp. CAU 1602]MCS1351324.1 DegV family protein [Mechercharimyces sp. CAU 1602]
MKKKIAWVTDSSIYLPNSLQTHADVYVVPLSIIFHGQIYKDGIDLTPSELYDKIDKSEKCPTTSQPPLATFMNVYEELKKEYDGAIAVHLSSDLSGTCSTSGIAASMVDFPVEVVDSRLLSYPMAHMIMKGMMLAEEGLEQAQIAKILRTEHKKVSNYILVGDLQQLYKGGRINGIQRLVGTLLQIHPILQIKEGAVHIFGKFRTKRRALAAILTQLEEASKIHVIQSIQILHADVIEEAEALKERIKKAYRDVDVLVGPLSSTIGVHGGKGSMVLVWRIE